VIIKLSPDFILSADKTRQFGPPTVKKQSGRYQATFQSRGDQRELDKLQQIIFGYPQHIKRNWMKRKIKFGTVFIIVFIFSVLVLIIGRIININYYKGLQEKRKMYCYEQYWKVVNPVLFVKDYENIDSLVAYYQKIEKGDTNPVFNFPPLLLPLDTCVYILGYERHSLVANMVCFYNWGKGGNYVKGYVYSHTLHNNPPPDRLIHKH
jgi:hypothetical protein